MGGNIMSLAKKIEKMLKDELAPEDIKTVIDIAEFLKLKKDTLLWDKINESEPEYISDEENRQLEEIKGEGEFISQEDVLKKLGITKDDL
jgi:hypothetical protein